MKTKVKICGIRHIETAEMAIAAGADFLGFNFVLSSRRFINPMKAKIIIDKIRHKIITVGVFKDATVEEVNEHIKYLKLDFVQLHGEENEVFMQKIKAEIIKTIPVHVESNEQQLLTEMKTYSTKYFLLDRDPQGGGQMIPVEKASFLAQSIPVFFAGGLVPENVGEIVSRVKPFAVDVASGIETNGYEDSHKILTFIKNAKGAIE